MQVNIRGVDIDYELTGSGRRFVWGHGLTSSRADEDAPPALIDFSRLATAAGVVRYDARGHGRSGFTADPQHYRWEELAADQLALADHLGVDRFAAGGASMGAATALHTAVEAPERVESLVLVIPPTAWETRAEQTGLYTQMAEIIERRGVELLISAGATVPPPDPFRDDPAYPERRAARMRAADPVRLAGLFRGAVNAQLPSKEAVAAITAPTLILAWTGDPAHPVSSAEELHRLMPNAELALASDVEELVTWTDRIGSFLAS